MVLIFWLAAQFLKVADLNSVPASACISVVMLGDSCVPSMKCVKDVTTSELVLSGIPYMVMKRE